jgi:macrolide transport system ATP-binding/permease protein
MNLARFFRRATRDADLAQELESHLAHEVDDNLARGISAGEAWRQAYLRLGNPLVIRDTVWESNRIAWLEDLWRDSRYAVRTLGKSPSFTLVAMLVMALGIGANTAIYSFLDTLLLRSLPVADPHSLVVLNWHAKPSQRDFVMQSMSGTTDDDPKLGMVAGIFPYAAFEMLQKKDGPFSDIFAYCRTREVSEVSVVIHGQARVAHGELVSGGYFQGLGVVPSAGRLIASEDDRVGAPLVVAVSHAFSERVLGGPVAAVGQSILISSLPFTVIGVTPSEFFGVDPAIVSDIYFPMHSNIPLGAQMQFGFDASDYLDPHYYWVNIMARLRPGVSLEQAEAQTAPQFQHWAESTAQNEQQRANLPALDLKEGATGLDSLRRRFSRPFYLLLTLVTLILALACSNVANLLLTRAATRKREIALRLSEGASRFRVIRQLLTESILLASAGGLLGVLLAMWGIRLLSLLLEGGRSEIRFHAQLNWHVLLVAASLSLLTGVLFGLVPALQSTDVNLATALKETRSFQVRSRSLLQWVSVTQLLVVGQIAISLLMLVAAGLFVRTLSNLQSLDLGFNREKLLLFEVNARQSGHQTPGIYAFYESLRQRFATLAGVRGSSLAESSLLDAGDALPISLPGQLPRDDTRFMPIGPGFLTTMQIPLVAGRDFDERDRPGSKLVAVINEEFARINFENENPLGRHLVLWKEILLNDKEPARDMEIVGVARNANYGGIRQQIRPVVYFPYDQGYPAPNAMVFVIRTTGDPLGYANTIREIVHQADTRLPVADIRTQEAEIADEMHQEITLAELCSAFAILALTIACVGLYGTISYTVARRTGEIGIRIALGAQRGPVLWMILREVLILATVGLTISIPIALGASKFLKSFLFEMKPNDPTALATAITILLAAALLAGCIPARRAARIDPMTALRHE